MNKKVKFIDSGSVKSPTTLRRIVAGLLDLILLMVLSSVVFVFVAQPIADTNPTYRQTMRASQAIMLDSGLYVQTDHDIVKIYNQSQSFDEIDTALSSFYCRFQSCTAYQDLKLNHIRQTDEAIALFYVEPSTDIIRVVEAQKESAAMTLWLTEQVDHALIHVLQETSLWRDAYTAMMMSIIFVIVIAFVFVSLVLYLLIPSRSFGQTIGHRLMGISIYSDREEDIIPSSKDVMIRYLAFAFIQLIAGLLTLGIVPLVSLLTAINGKKKLSFHDRLSRTKLVSFTENPTDEIDAFARKALYGEDVDPYA